MKEKREDGRMQAIIGEQIVDVPPSPIPPLKDIPCWNEDPPVPKAIQAVLDKLAGSQGKVTGVKPPEQPTLTPAGNSTTDPAGKFNHKSCRGIQSQIPPGKPDYKSRREN